MPARARKEIVRVGEPGIYHCWSRCVRRAWLMGEDPYTKKDFSHRRFWVIDRLEWLVRCFAIDVGFFATLSNHLHLVLRVNPRLVRRWGDQEVARRWLRAYPGTRDVQDGWIEPSDEQVEELARDKARIREYRKRLANLSWFMAALSEFIARRANEEDDTNGRFWQGRFGCREITSEGALLVCGAYVDLNQLRAGEALTPSQSWCSSIAFRLRASEEGCPWLARLTLREDDLGERPCASGLRASDKGLLPLTLQQYAELLEWTAARSRDAGGTRPPVAAARLLERLGVVPEMWLGAVASFPSRFRRMAGNASQLAERAGEAGKRWFQGARAAAQIFL